MEPDHLEFYKEVYYKELERRNSLNTEIALQGTTLVGVISGLFYLLTNIKSNHAWVHHTFTSAVAAEVVVASITAYFIMRSYYDFVKRGRRFDYLPKMRDVDNYYRQVDQREFSSFLRDSFITACDSHITHNDHKTNLLTRASHWMTRLMIGSAIITVFFICNYLLDNPNVKTTSNDESSEPKQSTAATARPASASITATAKQPTSSTTAYARARRARGQDTVHAKVK